MNHLNEIVRLGKEVNAAINQGTVAGSVLGVGIACLLKPIVGSVVDAGEAIAFMVICVVSQLLLAAFTYLRLRKIWARRRQLLNEFIAQQKAEREAIAQETHGTH